MARPKKNKTALVPVKKKEIAPVSVSLNPMELIQAAVKSGASMDVLERLMNLNDRVKADMAASAFRDAMAAFQAECPVIIKKKRVFNSETKGGKERYRYAPLDDIVKQTHELIGKHGFSYNIQTEQHLEPPSVQSTVTISHIAGHTEKSSFTVPVDKDAYMTEPQKWLAAASFAKRIAFSNAFGILTGDEDNNTGVPEDDEKKKAEDERAKAALEKLKSIPEDIKKGFDILGYRAKTVWQFCEDRKWDFEVVAHDLKKAVEKYEQKL